MTEEYNEDHFNILLAQMLRVPVILQAATGQLEGMFLTNKEIGGTPAQAILFDCIKRHYTKFGTAPDEATLIADSRTFLTKYFADKAKRKKVQDKIVNFLIMQRTVGLSSQPVARAIIKHVADICVMQPAVRELLAEPSRTGVTDGLGKQLTELEGRQASLMGGLSVSSIVGLDLGDVGMRVSTGVPWLDSRFIGGGPPNGSTIGIIMPQNGGKTTLGIQLGVGQALLGKHVLLVLAEIGLNQSMRSKILGCALGIDYTKISANPNLAEVIGEAGIPRELAKKKLEMIDEYLHVLDMVQKNLVPEGVNPISAELSQLISADKKPAYVYVDWAGIIADAVSKVSGRSKEAEIQSISFALTSEAARTDCIIAISQQMSPTYVKLGPFAEVDMYCAADCRMFTAPMAFAIAVNKRDPRTDLQLLRYVKSRDDALLNQTQVVKLRGELATFFDVSDSWRVMGKRFAANRDNEGATNKAPSENKSRGSPKDEVE